MKILVTGAAGFIGSHLAQKLCSLGHDVVGVDSFTDYYAAALKELNATDVVQSGVSLVRKDLVDDGLENLVEGVEVVYHLAAQSGISATTPLETYVRNNLTATHKLLEAVEASRDLVCFVNISSSSVYGSHATDTEESAPKPTSYYGVTKLAAEQLALAYHREKGMPVSSFRLFSVYGPRERPEKLYPKLICSILEGSEFPLYQGSEQHRRSYSFIDDILAGLVAVLDRTDACVGEILNLGSDVETTTGEGIRIVETIMGREANKVIKPRRLGDQLHTHANIDKARRLLGYAPTTTPEVGLRAEVEWYEQKVFGKVTP